MYKIKLTKNSRNNLVLFLTSFFVTFFYFSPFVLNALRGYKPELRFLGDLEIDYFPAFVQTSKYFHDWIFKGMDFFTSNGSSSLFIRPNQTVYYLPQLLIQTIFNVSTNALAVKLFTLQMWFNGFIAMLFTCLWLNKIIRLNVYISLLGGSLFFSIVSYIYGQITFFYIACTFPAVLYCLSLSLTRKTNIYEKILLSVPFVVTVTAGYIPIAVMSITVAIIASPIICKYFSKERQQYKDFALVLAIGALVTSGYMLAITNAHSIVNSIPKIPLIENTIFNQMSLTFKGAISIFFRAMTNDVGEAPHIRLGLPILILLYVTYQHLLSNGIQWKKKFFLICLILFLLSILLGLGRVSGFADIFFYSVPGLGDMHIYARYMLISVFFLVFGLTLGLSDLYTSDKPLNLKPVSSVIVIAIIMMLLFPNILTDNGISLPILTAELLVSILVLLALHLKDNCKYSLLLIPILLFSQGASMYMWENWITFDVQGNTAKDIINNESRMSALVNYFYSNTNKTLIKYIDLTPEIEKPGGVPLNFPWLIRYQSNDTRRISNYMGYEQALSQQREYAAKFSYYGVYDKDYILDSGADYIIYDRKTQTKELSWLKTVINQKVPEYDIGNGFFAVKVLQFIPENTKFDNGVFRVLSDDSNFKIDSFKTNWATKIELDFNTSKNGKVYFELFPHKNLRYYLNGMRVEPIYSKSGLVFFNFSAGKNHLIVVDSNTPLTIFLYIYVLYILAIALILVRYLCRIVKIIIDFIKKN